MGELGVKCSLEVELLSALALVEFQTNVFNAVAVSKLLGVEESILFAQVAPRQLVDLPVNLSHLLLPVGLRLCCCEAFLSGNERGVDGSTQVIEEVTGIVEVIMVALSVREAVLSGVCL